MAQSFPSPFASLQGGKRSPHFKLKKKNAGLITQAGVLLRHTDDRSKAGQSVFSMFQNIGIAAPFVTPVSEVRQMLGTLYSPSGM